MVKDETMKTEAVFKDNNNSQKKKGKEKRILWTEVRYCVCCALIF